MWCWEGMSGNQNKCSIGDMSRVIKSGLHLSLRTSVVNVRPCDFEDLTINEYVMTKFCLNMCWNCVPDVGLMVRVVGLGS